MSGAAETRPTGQQSSGGFEDTVKDFWASRPRRPRHGRKVAGVASAIGNRYGIDPVVIRVLFVAAAIFGGAGLLLYLLGWLFFPEENDTASPFEALIGRGRSSTSQGFTVLLLVLLIPTCGWTFSGGWFDNGLVGSGFVGLALAGAGLYVLHRNRGHLNRPAVPTGPVPEDTFGANAPTSAFSAGFSMTGADDEATTTTQMNPGAPPAWDPLGAAPLAWDLPDPAPAPEPPPPPRPPRPRTKLVPVTFGLALLVAGASVAAALSGASWLSPAHIIGLTLGVLGIGMVASAFAGGGRGLIGLAIPLSIAGLILTAVPALSLKGGFGDINATPVTAAQIQPVYQHTAGNIDLDLTRLPAGDPVRTRVANGAGNSTVVVPATADVHFTCAADAGQVNCLDRHTEGVGNSPVTGDDLGPDGPGGLKIDLTVQNGAGNVEVHRG
jgi:phage shock protein PspC (stress-responsive transcriptional regulator)